MSWVACFVGCLSLALSLRIEWRHYQAQKAYRETVAEMRRQWRDQFKLQPRPNTKVAN